MLINGFALSIVNPSPDKLLPLFSLGEITQTTLNFGAWSNVLPTPGRFT